jgi:hypothetical protein
MHRTALIAVALALVATACAQNGQATQAAKTQRSSALAVGLRARREAAARNKTHFGTHFGTYSGSGSTRNASVARDKRTPDEVGRSAGLAIRRQAARKQLEWHDVAARKGRARNGQRLSRRPRLEPAALRFASRDRADDPPDTESARQVPPQDSESDYSDDRANDRISGAGSDLAAPEAHRPVTNGADAETAPANRTAHPQVAAERDDDAAMQDDDERTAGSASQAIEAAGDTAGDTARGTDSASAERKAEVASLSLRTGRMPAPLRGSLASLQRQNDRVDAEGLERIENEADLAARIANKLLVPLPASIALTVNAELEENHRYCRPWTARFLADLARAHEAAFHRSIEVSSAVRTVEYQKRLMEINGNAAPAEGDMVSPHLTGATIDIAKSGLSRSEIWWMRLRLAGLQAAGKIDVEEEFKQSCFHITVYKSYVSARKAGPVTTPKPDAHGDRPQTTEPVDQPEAQGD